MIQLRRNPFFAIALQVTGAIALGIGLFSSEYWLVVAGVILFGAGALMLINPKVTIEKDEVVLKNLLGFPRASYPHDGLPSLSIVEDKLLIRHEGRQAILQRVAKSGLHPGDWRFLVSTLEEIEKHRKSKS